MYYNVFIKGVVEYNNIIIFIVYGYQVKSSNMGQRLDRALAMLCLKYQAELLLI